MILFLILLLSSPNVQALSLSECEPIFLGEMRIKSLLEEEKSKDNSSKELIKLLSKVRSCSDLLDLAKLKDNGMVIERNPISAKILETFVNFHHKWIMPKDPERQIICQDKYQWDVYDQKAPSYHMTRALFQESRDAQLMLSGYGDLRSVRVGQNPESSKTTGNTSEKYQSFLGTTDKFQFTGDAPIIGFLYKRKLSATNFKKLSKPTALVSKENWPKENLNIYKHFGGGLLGSTSFLYYYGQREAFYRSNGRQRLPRKYANAIWNNLLCEEPKIEVDEIPDKSLSWNHPITQEKNCLACHKPLDEIAGAFRHITFIPTNQNCSSSTPQILIPFSFKANGSQNVWNPVTPKDDDKESVHFHLSYPVGFHDGQRVVGLGQLGKSIAKDPRFYRCQVIKYFKLIHGKVPPIEFLEKAANEYRESQNGLLLLKKIVARRKR